MKPLKLELQAFGPFVGKQEIDFEKLSRDGVFLIKGDTGSGKTTIFDAITVALYGGASGEDSKSKNGRNDFEEWRCTQADRSIETYVSFTFLIRGKTYRFKRVLTQSRVNLNAKYEAGEVDAFGALIPFSQNITKETLNKKAEELIGLTKEQFRQVVLLPQGQFERFLVAPSGEKEGILKKIFGTEQWERYAQTFYNAAYERKQKLVREGEEVQNSLSEDGVNDLDALVQRIGEMETERANAQETHRLFDGARRRETLNADRQLKSLFDQMHAAEDELKRLEAKREEIERLRISLKEAEDAESLRDGINAFENADKAQKQREAALQSGEKQLPEAQKAEAEAAQAIKMHEADAQVESLSKTIGEYEAKLPVYQSAGALRDAYLRAERVWKTTKKEAEQAEKEQAEALETAVKRKAEFDAAETTARTYRNRYFDGIYGEIAETLADGARCPVCGSTSHPMPAVKKADSIGKEAVEAAEADADRKKTLWKDAETARENAERIRSEKAERLNRASHDLLKAKTETEAAERNLIEGIADERALIGTIELLKAKIEQYTKTGERLKQQHEETAKKYAAALETVRIARNEYAQAKEALVQATNALTKALRQKGYSDLAQAKARLASQETRNGMRERIVSFETSYREATAACGERREALIGKTEPDAAAFKAREDEINEESMQFHKRDAALETNIARLTKKKRMLTEKWTHYQSQIGQADSDLAFARKLRGETGIGLSRYVLAVMFNQVIADANRMLTNVHNGRYRLYRTDEKGKGNKCGLELKVHDSRTPDKPGRSVALLSGGEKFLVSLALSIGISTVAQRSGLEIEALFIDEGFGTLDDRSIRDAMDVLDSVRRTCGTIGIISHIPLLEDWIATRVNVVKKESGSTIESV